MSNWKNKLLAFLHDPPRKCFDLGTHSGNAARLMRAAGFSAEETNDTNALPITRPRSKNEINLKERFDP